MNNEKNILAIRIKDLRSDMKLTQEELAKKLGLNNKSSIANYESGYSVPSDDIKLKMCEVFNCSMDYLMGKSNYRNEDDFFSKNIKDTLDFLEFGASDESNFVDFNYIEKIVNNLSKIQDKQEFEIRLKAYVSSFPKEYQIKLENYIRMLCEYSKNFSFSNDKKKVDINCASSSNDEKNINVIPTTQYYMCPVYGQISAGQPNWAEENIEGRIPIDTNLMDIVNPEEHFFLRVNGESMNKIIKNGAFALIHKQDVVENGEIAVVLVNGYDATLKKFSKQGDIIVLTPESTDESFKQQIYTKDTPIQIIGKYVGKMEINK